MVLGDVPIWLSPNQAQAYFTKRGTTNCQVETSSIIIGEGDRIPASAGKRTRQFGVRRMKNVMIAVFAASMGLVGYLFGILVTNHDLTAYQTHLTWTGFGILLLAAILSISWACVLGYREDKEKHRIMQLQIDILELEKSKM